MLQESVNVISSIIPVGVELDIKKESLETEAHARTLRPYVSTSLEFVYL